MDFFKLNYWDMENLFFEYFEFFFWVVFVFLIIIFGFLILNDLIWWGLFGVLIRCKDGEDVLIILVSFVFGFELVVYMMLWFL